MKKLLPFLCFLYTYTTLFSQDVSDIMDTVNANNLAVNIDPFNTLSNGQNSTFEFPNGSGLHTISASWIWVSGRSSNKNFIVAETNENDQSDFYPGPFSNNNNYPEPVQKTWFITIDQIENHIQQTYFENPDYVMPDVIRNWPAHGDPSLGQSYYLAPFEDVNGNHYYDPQNGDFPKIKGKQCLYYIMNDQAGSHLETNGQKMGLEIHCMFYQYVTNTYLNNTIFADIKVINKSSNTYEDCQFSIFTDIGIGEAEDDFVGINVEENYYYGYNDGEDLLYGVTTPIQMISVLNVPDEAIHNNQRLLSGFVTYENNNSEYGIPENAEEYFHLNHNLWKNGEAITYGGNGHQGSTPTAFMYTGESFNLENNDWYMYNSTNAFDVRTLGNIGPFTMEPGTTSRFEFAYFATMQNYNDIEDNLTHLSNANEEIQLYYNTIISTDIASNEKIHYNIYPNPATDIININANGNYQLNMYNLTGQIVHSTFLNERTSIDVSTLQPGIYFLELSDGQQRKVQKIIIR